MMEWNFIGVGFSVTSCLKNDSIVHIALCSVVWRTPSTSYVIQARIMNMNRKIHDPIISDTVG